MHVYDGGLGATRAGVGAIDVEVDVLCGREFGSCIAGVGVCEVELGVCNGDRTPGEASLSELEGLESIDCGYHLALCFVLLCLPFVPVSY